MATPVYEAIMQEIAERVAECTTANGYAFNVTAVIRRARGETPQYFGGTVELWTGDIADVDGSSWQGGAYRTFTMTAELALFVASPDSQSEPADTLVANAVAEVHRALEIGDLLGLCNTIFQSLVSNFAPEPGQAAGALVTYTITFDAQESDITQGRSA